MQYLPLLKYLTTEDWSPIWRFTSVGACQASSLGLTPMGALARPSLELFVGLSFPGDLICGQHKQLFSHNWGNVRLIRGEGARVLDDVLENH